jgi:hypothetical protein
MSQYKVAFSVELRNEEEQGAALLDNVVFVFFVFVMFGSLCVVA